MPDGINTLSRVGVVNRAGDVKGISTKGVEALEGFAFIPIGEGWTDETVRLFIKEQLGNNQIDEAVIQGDDGKAYLVFADKLPRAICRGKRIVSDQLSGTVTTVKRELDGDKIRERVRGKGKWIAAIALWPLAPFLSVAVASLSAVAEGRRLLMGAPNAKDRIDNLRRNTCGIKLLGTQHDGLLSGMKTPKPGVKI